MGSLSIQKGKRAERDVAKVLNQTIIEVCARLEVEPFRVMRNLKQTQSGGFDLDGIAWLAIEIKHHKAVALAPWWAQTLRQAGPQPEGGYSREPILIWKQHGGQWRVRMFARLRLNPDSGVGIPAQWLRVVADITFAEFMQWFERRLVVELENRGDEALTLLSLLEHVLV